MNSPIIILGAGGHARVLLSALNMQVVHVLGVTDIDTKKIGQLVLGTAVIGTDDEIAKYPNTAVHLVNGLGSVRVNRHRNELFERFKNDGYFFASIIHPSAIVASDVVLSEGVQIMAGAVIQTGCTIGKNVIVNTGAVVDHDCKIADHAHIAPGAVLSGEVEVGEQAHIGTGATIIQGIKIGRNSLIAAGAVVIRDVAEAVAVAGVPAGVIKIC